MQNVTPQWIDFLLNAYKIEDFAPTIGTFGDRGGGKTCLTFINLTILLCSDTKPHFINGKEYYRRVALFRTPESLLEEIQKAFPKEISSKFRVINDIYDARPYEIVYCDEAALFFDGKLALKKENREIMEGFTYARHNSIPIFYNTVKPGILKDLKIFTNVFIYKRLSDEFIQAFIDLKTNFVKYNAYILSRLKIDRALIKCNYNKYYFRGGLIMPKSKYCPWFNDAISTNMRGKTLAADRSQRLEKKESLVPVINEIVEKFGPTLKKPHQKSVVKGWFLTEKPLLAESVSLVEFNEIFAKALYIYELNRNDEDEDEVDENAPLGNSEVKVPAISTELREGTGFDEFLRNFYLENLPERVIINRKSTFDKQIIAEIARCWAAGIGQRKIQVTRETNGKPIPLQIINQILQTLRDGNGAIRNDLRYYFAYEHWIGNITSARVEGNVGRPDLWYKVNTVEYPGECKIYDEVLSTITIDKRTKLKPSYDYCKSHGFIKFPFFFRNPKWGDKDFLYWVPIEGDFFVHLEKNHPEFSLSQFNHHLEQITTIPSNI